MRPKFDGVNTLKLPTMRQNIKIGTPKIQTSIAHAIQLPLNTGLINVYIILSF